MTLFQELSIVKYKEVFKTSFFISNNVIISWLYSNGNTSTFAIKTLNFPTTYSSLPYVSIQRNGYSVSDFTTSTTMSLCSYSHACLATFNISSISCGARYALTIILVGY